MRYKHTNKRDINDHDVIMPFKMRGYPVIQLLPGQGADYLVCLPGGMFVVEIKQPGRYALTEDEQKTMTLFNGTRPDCYKVLQSAEDSSALILQYG